MNLAPQLTFAGRCREAFHFYAELFGGEITVMNTFGGNEGRRLARMTYVGITIAGIAGLKLTG